MAIVAINASNTGNSWGGGSAAYQNYEHKKHGDNEFAGGGVKGFFVSGGYKYFNITLGDIYDQFGSGVLLRLYEERSLGVDNALRGARLTLTPYKGITFKALGGMQRQFFNFDTANWYGFRYQKSGAVMGANLDLDIEESNGTKKLFQILLRLLDVVRNKKALMMDEFDMGLHTRLADFILDLIHASESSQLLFTSHNTNLIDMKRLRKDQILFVNKLEDGSTDVYSLYDYKDFRENMDAEKGYIQGRFDAVPFVDSSVMNLKQLMED